MDFHIFTIKITFPIGIYRVSCSPVPGGSPAYYMIWVYPDGHYDETNKKSQKHYLLQHNSKIYQIKKTCIFNQTSIPARQIKHLLTENLYFRCFIIPLLTFRISLKTKFLSF